MATIRGSLSFAQNFVALPTEILLIILDNDIPKTHLKIFRTVCRKLEPIASEVLYRTLTFAFTEWHLQSMFYVAHHPVLCTYVTHLACNLTRHTVLTMAEYEETLDYSGRELFEDLQVQESYDHFRQLLEKQTELVEIVWDTAFLKQCLPKLANLRHVSCSHQEAWPAEFYSGCLVPMALSPIMLGKISQRCSFCDPKDLFNVTQALKEARVPVQFSSFQPKPCRRFSRKFGSVYIHWNWQGQLDDFCLN